MSSTYLQSTKFKKLPYTRQTKKLHHCLNRWIGSHFGRAAEVSQFVRLIYFQERRDNFTDGFGTPVAAQSFTLGHLSFGPKVAREYEMGNGMTSRPELALSGVRDFDAFEETTSNKSDISARLEGNVSLKASERVSLTANACLDGLGNDNYGLWGGSISANINF